MVTLLSFQFWFNFFLFILYSFFIFYLPGRFFLKNVELTQFQKSVLSFGLGMVLWTIQGFIFGYLNIRWFSYVYIIVFVVFALKSGLPKFHAFKFNFDFIKKDKFIIVLLLLGIFVQTIGVWTMGLRFENGIHFCCGHVPDNILELAITNEIVHRFPPFEPGMYGVVKQNYHYWSHLLMGDFIRVTNLPLIPTVYQYFSILISLLLGLLAIVFAQILKLKKSFIYFLLFFLYFGADLVFLFPVFAGNGINFGIGSMEDGTKFLLNYPRAFAVVFYLLGLSMLSLWLEKRKNYILFLSVLVFGTLIGFKVYVGFFALTGLGVLSLYFLIKKQFKVFAICLLPFLISAVIYIPYNLGAGGLIYMGFWRVNDFVANPNIGFSHLELARRVFESSGNNKVFLFEILFSLLFLVGTFGIRLIGLFQTKKSLQSIPKEIHYFLVPAMIVSMILGLFFWQKTGGANTFNFIVNVLLFSSFYCASVLSATYHKVNRKFFLAFFIFLMVISLPRIVYSTYSAAYAIGNTYMFISSSEMNGIEFLKEQTLTDSLIAISPAFKLDHISPYVTFLSDRPSFFSGLENELIAHGIEHSEREKSWRTIFNSQDKNAVLQEISNNNIDYLYLSPNSDKVNFYVSQLGLKEVFRNNAVVILKTQREG